MTVSVSGLRDRLPGRLALRRYAGNGRARLEDLAGDLASRLGPVRRYAGPPAVAVLAGLRWVTVGGWLAVVAATAGLVVGLREDWREYLVLGLTCAVALLFAVGWTLGRSRFEVVFELVSNRVTAGETASGRVEIRNQARRSFLPARIELTVGAGTAFFLLPGLGRGDAHEQLFDVPTRSRGVIPVGPVSSVRSDPLHLLRRTQRWSDSVPLYVHPPTVYLSSDSTGFIRDIEGVTTQDLSSNDVSFHALREYQPGDDRRAIHWRTTARVNKLMVRQFEETRRAHLLVLLPTALADYAEETDFECAISVAGSLARHAFREEREVSVYTSSGLLQASTSALLLDELAALEPARTSLTLRTLAARAVGAVPQASVCALVAGGDAEPRDLRAAHKTLPAAVIAFALRCAADRPLARSRIGDLTVVDLPDLASLPIAMRSIG